MTIAQIAADIDEMERRAHDLLKAHIVERNMKPSHVVPNGLIALDRGIADLKATVKPFTIPAEGDELVDEADDEQAALDAIYGLGMIYRQRYLDELSDLGQTEESFDGQTEWGASWSWTAELIDKHDPARLRFSE